MWPFRRLTTGPLDVQPVGTADLAEVLQLQREAIQRFDVLYPDDAAEVIRAGLGVVVRRDGRLAACGLFGRPLSGSVWLRAVAIAPGESARQLLPPLLEGLQQIAVQQHLQILFYGTDDETDDWMLPALQRAGYEYDTDVVVFAKHDCRVPAFGSRRVTLRPAHPTDLPDLEQLDRRCFTAQWRKDGPTLAQALRDGPVTLAELGATIVGYTYVSRHYGGRLAHLVRIAVDPSVQHQAIGVRLMSAFVSAACADGAETLTLNTQAFNQQAQRLYQWFGFAPTGERQVVMRCVLPPPPAA